MALDPLIKYEGKTVISARRRLCALCLMSAISVIGFGGCSEPSVEQLIVSAKASLAKNDAQAAQVHLKSALQVNPNSAQARYLLGKALFQSGNPAGALVEFEKAAELKHPDAELLPSLASALLAVGRAKQVTDRFDRTELPIAAAAADLKASVALAYASQGMVERSEASTAQALQFNPKNVSARLLQARLMAAKQNPDGALAQLEALIVDAPKEAKAWNLKGDILAGYKRDTVGGAIAYAKALEADPKFLPAHKSRIRLAMLKKDPVQHQQAIADLKKALPNSLDTRYFEAQHAFVRRQTKEAREITQTLLKSLPNDPDVLHLAGAIELQAGSLVLAESYLTKALQFDPRSSASRRLLAQTHLRSGEPARALATLQPLLEQPAPDVATLRLAASAHLQNGQFALAEAMYGRAAKVAPDDPQIRTALASAQIAKGNSREGLADLEAIAQEDDAFSADYALISARLQLNDVDGALTAISRLITKQPASAVPHHLRGQILARKKDIQGARESFDKAVAVDANFYPAVAALVAFDIADKKHDAAILRLEQQLKREPRTYLALQALIQLRQLTGGSPESIRALLDGAIRLNPGEVAPRLMLVDHLLARRDAAAAKLAAQEGLSVAKDHPALLDAQGRAQLQAGEYQQAVSSFAKVASAQPASIAAQMRLAEAQMANKDLPSAARSLQRVLEIDPKSLVAQRSLLQIAVADKRFADALSIARSVQKQRPSESVGFLLEGDLFGIQREWDKALSAFRTALSRDKSPVTAIQIHSLLGLSGKAAESNTFAKGWLSDRPNDAMFRAYLGTEAVKNKDLGAAEGHFRAVLAVQPENASALNNLAWILVQQNRPGALELAKRANTAAPEDPAVMDTLAAIHMSEGRLPEAIEWQRKALAKVGDTLAPRYRLHMARLQIKAGDKTSALAELQRLAYMGDKFPEQAEVAELLKTLKQ